MKVLLVGPTPPPFHGGAVITRNLMASPLAERFDVVHVDTSDRRGLANLGALDLRNVWLAAVHGGRFLAALLRQRPDVAHVPVAQNRLGLLRDCLFLLPARVLGTPVVVHLNGGYCRFFRDSGAATRALSRLALGGAARVLVLGERLRGELDGVVPAERVEVVPYGVPDAAAPRDGGAAAGEPGGGGADARGGSDGEHAARPLRVLYLGTLNRTKGFVDLLAAAQQVVARRDNVEFVFAGDFATPADASAAAPLRERLGERARFVGVLDGAAKTRALAEADLFVFPSYYRYEGQPLVILEAMAAGLPVLTTDHGVIAETVVDGETGRLLPARDPTALAAAILALAEDPVARRRMGRAGRARFLARHTLEGWADRIGPIWLEAANATAERPAATA